MNGFVGLCLALSGLLLGHATCSFTISKEQFSAALKTLFLREATGFGRLSLLYVVMSWVSQTTILMGLIVVIDPFEMELLRYDHYGLAVLGLCSMIFGYGFIIQTGSTPKEEQELLQDFEPDDYAITAGSMEMSPQFVRASRLRHALSAKAAMTTGCILFSLGCIL